MTKYIQPTIKQSCVVFFRQVVPCVIATQKRLITVEALMTKYPTMTLEEKSYNNILFLKVMTPLSRNKLEQVMHDSVKKYAAGTISENDAIAIIDNSLLDHVKMEMSPDGTAIRSHFGKGALTPTTELGDLPKEDYSDSD
jgi:transcription elongation factor GreA-like protein